MTRDSGERLSKRWDCYRGLGGCAPDKQMPTAEKKASLVVGRTGWSPERPLPGPAVPWEVWTEPHSSSLLSKPPQSLLAANGPRQRQGDTQEREDGTEVGRRPGMCSLYLAVWTLVLLQPERNPHSFNLASPFMVHPGTEGTEGTERLPASLSQLVVISLVLSLCRKGKKGFFNLASFKCIIVK